MLLFFILACQKIVQSRLSTNSSTITPTNSRPTTPQGTRLGVTSYHSNVPSPTNGFSTTNQSQSPSHQTTLPNRHHILSASSHHIPIKMSQDLIQNESQIANKWGTISHGTSQQALVAVTNENNNIAKFVPPSSIQPIQMSTDNLQPLSIVPVKDGGGKDKDLPTPTSTPTTSRKSRRRSNLFIPSSAKKEQENWAAGGPYQLNRDIYTKRAASR